MLVCLFCRDESCIFVGLLGIGIFFAYYIAFYPTDHFA